MSDTTEAAVRKIRQDSPTVDAVCRQLAVDFEPGEADVAIAFASIFFSKASSEFLLERDKQALTHLVSGAYEFLKRSRPDRVDVEVFNPEVESEGWYAPVTVIRTNLSERPFIVDTIREFLHSQELPIEHNVYPVLHVERDASGEITSVKPSREGDARESLVHCEVPRIADEQRLQELRDELQRRLNDVKLATDDFTPMVEAVDTAIAQIEAHAADLPARRDELSEVQAFLQWLREGAFVFLGYRAYDLIDLDGEPAVRVAPGSGLGILRDESRSTYADTRRLADLPEWLREVVVSGPTLVITKTNAESTVHRRARMDHIGVRRLGPAGEILGEHRFVGLFTSKAFGEQAEQIPILRQKLQQILDESGVAEGSHDFKEINSIFNSMPKEELFLTSAEQIGADVRAVLTTYHSDDVKVVLRDDPLRRGSSLMVIMPKDRFSGEVRRQIEKALRDQFEVEVLNYHLALGSGDQARLHFYLGAPEGGVAELDAEAFEMVVRELIRSWIDRVREGLERVRPADEARRLARAYGEAFSVEYRASSDPQVAVSDILELEAMRSEGREITVGLTNQDPGSPAAFEATGGEPVTELKLHLRGPRLVLSDFMPILESCGMRVIAVNPFDVAGPDVGSAIIYTFAVQDGSGQPLDVEAVGSRLARALLVARDGDATIDSLNALVIKAGLSWREVDLLRAYAGYAFQAEAVPSRISIPAALVKYPAIASLLIRWFALRFDPANGLSHEDRRVASAKLERELNSRLADVDLLADDRALRRLGLLLQATVRTNYYRTGGPNPTRRSGGVPYISLKFDAQHLAAIRRTRLKFEVYVRSARMEGVHLRGASVARGGIRWSDRPDDFRTEVLGLVKTQMVKNAVIVPGGSKGGFVPTQLPPDPDARWEEAREQYRTLIRGLLDLTDNLDENGAPVAPELVVAWDDPDPYLVVAADKGTATFSDIANAVAAEYGFWLGDAFASGGSNGYDHKEVGITARGGWECVKRHFRELGKDIQAEPFTVAGIGDMSGDVFGNGMLLSEQIRLIAAFDHRHVFIDPDPDPATTFAERSRLFALGRSSWEDYDTSLLSEGGMIVPRGSKEVQLTPQAIAALGLDEDPGVLNGEELIRLVLKAPVELLWNGGIGTYVKARHETNSDAGDASNDAVRIDATELRAQVVGEGGNLGLTQAARIEYALAGGHINTDALDNSGGVSLSDREVNLKILLGPAVRAGDLGEEERNQLLEKLTDEIADRVLKDNWSQSLAVSLDALRVVDQLDEFRDLMSALERTGLLDRASEGLPSLETLVERTERGEALVRPELCVLLAYAKLSTKTAVIQSSLPDQELVADYLSGYFPEEAQERTGSEILGAHPLRREIITSQITNDLTDLMGATFVHRLVRDTGRTADEVVFAWLVAARIAGHRSIIAELTSAARTVRASDAYRWALGFTRVLERTTRWVLRDMDDDFDAPALLDRIAPGLQALQSSFVDVVSGHDRDLYLTRVAELTSVGGNEPLARRLITLRFLDQSLEVLRIANETGADVLDTARVYYHLSEVIAMPWLREKIFTAVGPDRWEQRSAQSLAADLNRAHHRLVMAAMSEAAGKGDLVPAADRLLEQHGRDVRRFGELLSELRDEEGLSLAALSVGVREVAALADRVVPR
jgi:glutamate dehydrogenase